MKQQVEVFPTVPEGNAVAEAQSWIARLSLPWVTKNPHVTLKRGKVNKLKLVCLTQAVDLKLFPCCKSVLEKAEPYMPTMDVNFAEVSLLSKLPEFSNPAS